MTNSTFGDGSGIMIHYMTVRGTADAWVGNELRMLRKAGIPFRLHALDQSRQNYFVSEDMAEIATDTCYLRPVSLTRVISAVVMAPVRFRGAFLAALLNAVFGPRESLRIRAVGLWHLCLACHWAALLRAGANNGTPVSHIHSQWIHSAGTVAMFGAWLLGRPFSFTGHAADLFRERAALKTKIQRAQFIICISEFHRQFFLENGARPEQLYIAYCGIDTSHFKPHRRTRGSDQPVHILAAGRLVEKKGFPILIRACAILKAQNYPFRCTIGGSGPDEAALRTLVTELGLDPEISLTGEALKQEKIPEFMYDGDVFCLPCVWAADNDVDGLPQLTMEAMACGLPVITTDLVGNPDLVRDGDTGLLVSPGDVPALADAIARLGGDELLAQKLAENGHAHVRDVFDIDRCLEPLLDKYRTALETSP